MVGEAALLARHLRQGLAEAAQLGRHRQAQVAGVAQLLEVLGEEAVLRIVFRGPLGAAAEQVAGQDRSAGRIADW